MAKSNEVDELQQLANFVLKQSFPHIQETGEAAYLAMFQVEIMPFLYILTTTWCCPRRWLRRPRSWWRTG